jgi:hypothetical protein
MAMTTRRNDPALTITRTTRRRPPAGGTWVEGTVAGHRFAALVFPEHADNPDFELGSTRISKLSVQPLGDPRMVFNFDRGLDVPAADANVERIVALLGDRLADLTFGTGQRIPTVTAQVTRRSRRGVPAIPAGPEFATAAEAIRHAAANRPVAIAVGGRYRVVTRAEADAMTVAGAEFAFLA